jgi:tetratricopeptide (TPR) repeat protein
MNGNYKVFISHSSAQKDFVEEVVHELGRDFVNVDMYCFEAGGELTDEITAHINNSNIFVLMLSDMALNSKWVIQEARLVHSKMLDGEDVVFLPFIVDDVITHSDDRFDKNGLKWVKKYLVKPENSSSIVARIIRRKLRESIWENEPTIKEREKLFFGRDADMNELRLKLYASTSNQKRAIIISGLSHIGRKRLVKEFIWRHVNELHEAYEPVRIVMTESDGMDRFVQQLNEVVRIYDNTTLLDIMRYPDKCLSASVELLNKIADCQERVFVRDEKSIVLGNGRLTDWFVDIIKNKGLYPMIHLYVASRFTPMLSTERNFPELIIRQIKGLDKQNIMALFNAYAKNRGISLNEADAKDFVKDLKGYPRQVYDVVDCIVGSDINNAKKQLPQIVSMFDGNLVDILDEIDKAPHAKDILVMLSQFDFVSFDLLEKVCPDNISDALELFRNYSLYESFGSANQYIRLSPVMADYISRNRITMPLSYRQSLRRETRRMLTSVDDSLTDLSSQLLGIKEVLKNAKVKAKERYLIPSFVLKVIIEEYKYGQDENVITLVEMLLNDNIHNGYDEIIRSINYWYCCSLCRMKNEKFLQAVEYFKNSDYSYYFLRGFYERHKGNYPKAEEYYEKALERSKSSSDREYVSKAEHELVIVKMELEDYSGALELAEKSYEREKDNSYHIEAYFRCLVRNAHADKELLRELITRMERSYAEGKVEIAGTMKAEYKFYKENDFSSAVLLMKEILTTNPNSKYAHRAFKRMCKDNDAENVYNGIMKEIRQSRS